MPNLLGLPTELRQHIVREALPEKIEVGRTGQKTISDLVALTLSCKTLNHDLAAVLKLSPLEYHLTHSHNLDRLAKGVLPKSCPLTHLRLVLFAYFSVEPGWRSAQMTLELWRSVLTRNRMELPRTGLQTICIDISPLPRWVNRSNASWVALCMRGNVFTGPEHPSGDLKDVIDQFITYMQITGQRQQPELIITGLLHQRFDVVFPELAERLKSFETAFVNGEGHIHVRVEVEAVSDAILWSKDGIVGIIDDEAVARQDPLTCEKIMRAKATICEALSSDTLLSQAFDDLLGLTPRQAAEDFVRVFDFAICCDIANGGKPRKFIPGQELDFTCFHAERASFLENLGSLLNLQVAIHSYDAGDTTRLGMRRTESDWTMDRRMRWP